MNTFKKFVVSVMAAGTLFLASCGAQATDANVVSQNLSTAADQFEIERRIVFINGITDNYILVVEGRCSINDDGNQLEVTCKAAGGEYKKHFLGLSDNVTYFAEQIESANVSPDHYKVILKPSTIIPDIDIK